MWGKTKIEEDQGLNYYTVYDSKARHYNEPFPGGNRDELLRDFTNAFRAPDAGKKNRYYINAEDYSIFRCAKFDKQTGEFEAIKPEHIVNCHDLRSIAQASQPSAQEMGIVPT